MSKDRELVNNRRASFDYTLFDRLEAGICLKGTEIKSLRAHGGNLQDAYVRVIANEAWLIGASIVPYSHGNINNHQERRDRKLLLHRKEIDKLHVQLSEKGMTAIPLSIFLQNGRAKLCIALAKGKKMHDKREAIKERDEKREMARAMKGDS